MDGSRLKVVVSVLILVIGLAATVLVVGRPSSADSSSGIIIDFGDYDIVYTTADEDSSPLDALSVTCESRNFDLETDGETVVSIDGKANGEEGSWRLFVVEKGSTEWTETVSATAISDYSAVCYGYCSEDSCPTPAVDGTGVCFYGYEQPSRVVSLAPSCTETLCAAGGEDLIVGTDQYSNYPQSVVDRQESGEISIVGGFTNPSFESILKADPDLVVCIDSQNAHIEMAEKLRDAGIDVLVLDGGESVQAVFDNMYATGTVLGSTDETVTEIGSLQDQMDTIEDIVSAYGASEKRVMVALSAVKSPWVSGADTYVDDVMSRLFIFNIYDEESGWVQVNAETVAKLDPEVIIIVSSDYEATQEDYDSMLGSMSSEWRSTSAYNDGEIYLFSGDAADCASRPGPRVAQLMELIAMAVQGDAFDNPLPKYVGDEYVDHLTITGGME